MARSVARFSLSAAALATLLIAFPYSSNADARGFRSFGYFAGGVIVGAALAPRHVYAGPRYVYPAPYYYPPPVYYAPYPATVTYVSPPPVVVQQPAPAPLQGAAPSNFAPLAQNMTIEDRLRRLRSMCEQGLFTEAECQNRREQLLQEM